MFSSAIILEYLSFGNRKALECYVALCLPVCGPQRHEMYIYMKKKTKKKIHRSFSSCVMSFSLVIYVIYVSIVVLFKKSTFYDYLILFFLS